MTPSTITRVFRLYARRFNMLPEVYPPDPSGGGWAYGYAFPGCLPDYTTADDGITYPTEQDAAEELAEDCLATLRSESFR